MTFLRRLLMWRSPGGESTQLEWRSIERFSANWRGRIRFMAGLLDEEDRVVVDLGCGPMWLRDELPGSVQYVGVDYKERGPGTVICDFNAGQFPDVRADTYFVSGCLEYVADWRWFISRISSLGRKCLISYCCVESIGDDAIRRRNAWVNSLSSDDIIAEFRRNGMVLVARHQFDANNTVFKFARD